MPSVYNANSTWLFPQKKKNKFKKVLKEWEHLIPSYFGIYKITVTKGFLKAGNKPNVLKYWIIRECKGKKAAVFNYVCSLQGGQEKERDAFINTSLLTLPLPKVCEDSKCPIHTRTSVYFSTVKYAHSLNSRSMVKNICQQE